MFLLCALSCIKAPLRRPLPAQAEYDQHKANLENARRVRALKHTHGMTTKAANEILRDQQQSSATGSRSSATMPSNAEEELREGLMQLLENEVITSEQFHELMNYQPAPAPSIDDVSAAELAFARFDHGYPNDLLGSPSGLSQAEGSSAYNPHEMQQVNGVHNEHSNVTIPEQNLNIDAEYACLLALIEEVNNDKTGSKFPELLIAVQDYHNAACAMLRHFALELRDCWPNMSHDTYNILDLVTRIDKLYHASKILSKYDNKIPTDMIQSGTLNSLIDDITEGISSLLSMPITTMSDMLCSNPEDISAPVIKTALDLLYTIQQLQESYQSLQLHGLDRILEAARKQYK